MDAELRLAQSQQGFSEMLSGMRAGSRRLSVLSQQLANTLKLRVEELTGKLALAGEAAAATVAAEKDETVAALRRAQSSLADLTEQLDTSRTQAQVAQARASEAGEQLLSACAREAALREETAQARWQASMLSAALEHAKAAGASASASAVKAREASAEQAEETARVAEARAGKAEAQLRGVVEELRRKEAEAQQLQFERERSKEREIGGTGRAERRTNCGEDGGDAKQVQEREMASVKLKEALAQMLTDGLQSGEAVLLKPVLDRLASVENRMGGLSSLLGIFRLKTQRRCLGREASFAALHAHAALLCAELASEELGSEAARGEAEQARLAFQDMALSLACWQERAARAEARALLPSDGQRSMLYSRLQGGSWCGAVAATDGDGGDVCAVALEAARLAGEATVGARLVSDARGQLPTPNSHSARVGVLYGMIEWRTAEGGRLLLTLLPDGVLSSEEARTKAAEARADALIAELNSLRQEVGAAAAMAEPAPMAGSRMDRAQASRLISRVKAVLAPIESSCSGGGGVSLEHARTLVAMVAAMSGSIPLPPSMATGGAHQSRGRGATQIAARAAANVAVSGCSPTVAGGMAGRRAATSHVPDFYSAWVNEKLSASKGERGVGAALNGKASTGLSVLGGKTNGQDAPSGVSHESSVANCTSPSTGLRRLRSGIASLRSPSPTRPARAAACCAAEVSTHLSDLVACRGGQSGGGGGGSHDDACSGAEGDASGANFRNFGDGGRSVGGDCGNRNGTVAAACGHAEGSQAAQSLMARSNCGELARDTDGCGEELSQPFQFGTGRAAERSSEHALGETLEKKATSQAGALAIGQNATREASTHSGVSACSEVGADKVGIAARRAEAPHWKFDAGVPSESGSGVLDLGTAARFARSSLTLTVPSASKSSVSAEKISSVARVRSASALRPVLREDRGRGAEHAALVKVASLSALRMNMHLSSAESPPSASLLGAAAPQSVIQEGRDPAQTAASAPRTAAFYLPGSISVRPNAAGCLTSGLRQSPAQRQ